jgi:predicted membrane GTPase involved in stress response
VSELFEYDNFIRVPAEVVEAGDICALSGISDVLVCSILILPIEVGIARI